MAQLICKKLSLGYDSKIVAENLDFSVSRGDYLCIVGENGAGKSTLIKTILGLSRPLGGELIFGDGANQNRVGYLPQKNEIQRDFPATVGEIVLSGLLGGRGIFTFYNKKDKEKAHMAAEKLGVENLWYASFRELSGGQQQRVLLCRALLSADKMLILDEPATGLDPKAASDMYDIIKKLNSAGMTVIMVTHDISASLKYASHILHIAHSPLYFGNTHGYVKSGLPDKGGRM